jgi:hypothetical protein
MNDKWPALSASSRYSSSDLIVPRAKVGPLGLLPRPNAIVAFCNATTDNKLSHNASGKEISHIISKSKIIDLQYIFQHMLNVVGVRLTVLYSYDG